VSADWQEPWYHGSPLVLTELMSGSTITQDRDLARVFSHKPTVVAQDVSADGERFIQHNGTQTVYLYLIAEPLAAQDLAPHPETTMGPGQEWLITRPVRLSLLEKTTPQSEELLSETMLHELRARGSMRGF